MYLETYRPISGQRRQALIAFLADCGLDFDGEAECTACLYDDEGMLAATGSLLGSTIRCVAVSPRHQGEDLTARVMTALRGEASQRGIRHLTLYTKPANEMLFRDFGFFPVIRTGDVLILENVRNGLENFLRDAYEAAEGPIGCVVANCDPFTRGHRHLIETAAKECALVHVFVLSENRGMFSPEARLRMVRSGTADLPNVRVHPGGVYMISSATFPTYFIRDKARVTDIRCGVDVRLFGERIAPALGITCRYVGSEPFDEVTRRYNEALQRGLPPLGIGVRQIDRAECNGRAISARRVRECLRAGNPESMRELVLPEIYQIITEEMKVCRPYTECSET